MTKPMITEEQIAAARLVLEHAEDDVLNMRTKRWYSPSMAAAYALTQQHEEWARVRLEAMIAERDAYLAALAARPEIEKANSSYITAASKDLKASAKRVAAAVQGVYAALAELDDAVTAHDMLVAQTSGELAAMGLSLQPEIDHETGGGRPCARLRGVMWLRVDPESFVGWVYARALQALYGFKAGRRPASLPVLANVFEKRSDALLDAIPRPATREGADTRHRWGRRVSEGAPVGLRAEDRAQAIRDREITVVQPSEHGPVTTRVPGVGTIEERG